MDAGWCPLLVAVQVFDLVWGLGLLCLSLMDYHVPGGYQEYLFSQVFFAILRTFDQCYSDEEKILDQMKPLH